MGKAPLVEGAVSHIARVMHRREEREGSTAFMILNGGWTYEAIKLALGSQISFFLQTSRSL